jgi:hypothetical protein
VVVLVKVAGQDAVDATADHLQERVRGEVGVAGGVEHVGQDSRESDALVELAKGEQPGVAGELARRRLDDQGRAEKIENLWPGGWYTRRLSPEKGTRPVGSPGETHTEVNDSKPR